MGTSGGPATKAELESVLDEFISRAYENGVTVDNGGYALRHDDTDLPDWEVQITRTVKPPQDGD